MAGQSDRPPERVGSSPSAPGLRYLPAEGRAASMSKSTCPGKGGSACVPPTRHPAQQLQRQYGAAIERTHRRSIQRDVSVASGASDGHIKATGRLTRCNSAAAMAASKPGALAGSTIGSSWGRVHAGDGSITLQLPGKPLPPMWTQYRRRPHRPGHPSQRGRTWEATTFAANSMAAGAC